MIINVNKQICINFFAKDKKLKKKYIYIYIYKLNLITEAIII